MKNTTPVRHTIRFRRWSRKAYAAFASIGHCVTIGCLPKSVADSSLAKQKSTCTIEYVWRGVTEEKETDIGIPIGSNIALICGTTESEMNPQILFKIQVIRPCVYAGEQEVYILKQRNYTARIIRTYAAHFFKPQDSANPCPFHIHEFNHRKI